MLRLWKTSVCVCVCVWTEASQERIQAVKDSLQSCKNLLHCKRDELRRLWIEGVEMKTVYASLDAVEQVKDVAEQIPGLIVSRKYLTATELVISSLAVLDTELSDVDALQQVYNVVFTFCQVLHGIIWLSKVKWLRVVEYNSLQPSSLPR